MKKLIIGALVGGLILFIWQFISWNFLHNSQMQYTANQDEILEMLEGKLEPGQYMLPRMPEGTSMEDAEAYMSKYTGKRWMQISYHDNMQVNMAMNMVRGFAIDFVSVFLLCWVFGRFREIDTKSAVMSSVAVGLIGYFTISYLNSIWFETDSMPDLIDAIVPWSIIGAWLGWWLNR